MADSVGINSLSVLSSASVGATSAGESAKAAVVKTGVGAPALDQASLSVAGGFAAQGDGDVRTEKVAALSAAIANGTYNVSADDVAGKILDSLLG